MLEDSEKAKAYDTLVEALGHVQNASDTPIHISQDDATNNYIVKVGNRTYWGTSLHMALNHVWKDL